MEKFVTAIGLQRSGTNYLTELMAANMKCKVYREPSDYFWKHQLHPPDLNPDYGHILIRKDIIMWLDSICHGRRVDLPKHYPAIFDGNYKGVDIPLAIGLYQSFYENWEGVCDLELTYEELLADRRGCLEAISATLEIPLRDNYQEVEKVRYSGSFKAIDEARYLNREHRFPKEVFEAIKKLV